MPMTSAYRRILSAAVTAAGVAFCSGCGSSAATTTAPATTTGSTATSAAATAPPASTTTAAIAGVDSCTVTTQSEAGAALGQTVKAPVRGRATVEGGVACVFYGPNAPPGASPDVPVSDSVRVVLVTGTDALSFFNDYRSKVHAQPISGLGDQAYFDGVASLSVLKGAAYVRIAVIGVSNVLGAEETLAKDALPRM
jgi:hypothetical protein